LTQEGELRSKTLEKKLIQNVERSDSHREDRTVVQIIESRDALGVIFKAFLAKKCPCGHL